MDYDRIPHGLGSIFNPGYELPPTAIISNNYPIGLFLSPSSARANSLPAAHTVSASRRQGRERTRREESVLPNYNDANDINDLNIAYIAKRRRVRELECRHVKSPGEWHREGGGRRVDGTK